MLRKETVMERWRSSHLFLHSDGETVSGTKFALWMFLFLLKSVLKITLLCIRLTQDPCTLIILSNRGLWKHLSFSKALRRKWPANILLALLNSYLELRQFMISMNRMVLFQDTNNKSREVYPERWMFYHALTLFHYFLWPKNKNMDL